jgi:hypothetical protein
LVANQPLSIQKKKNLKREQAAAAKQMWKFIKHDTRISAPEASSRRKVEQELQTSSIIIIPLVYR